MLSKSAGRVIPRTGQATLLPLQSIHAAQPCKRAASPGHQRRRSSSKTSHPRGSEPAASNSSSNTPKDAAEDDKRSGGRLARKRSSKDAAGQVATKPREEPFANLPAVPSTNHLHVSDVKISAFFSLHRPISVTNPFPSSTSTQAFNSIFDAPPRPTKISTDVVYTVAPSQGDGQQQSKEEKDLRWEVMQQSSSNAESGAPQNTQTIPSLEELVKQFRPFNVPPAPVPFDQPNERSRAQQIPEHQASDAAAPPPEADLQHRPRPQQQTRRTQRTFTTTVTINETTSPAGHKTITATATPVVERRARTPRSSTFFTSSFRQQPFLTRLLTPRRQPALAVRPRRSHALLPAAPAAAPAAADVDADAELDAAEAAAEAAEHVEQWEGWSSPPAGALATPVSEAGDAARISAATAAGPETAPGTAAGTSTGTGTAAHDPRTSDAERLSRQMQLISVKRQRKLKMKKHKYKKLMRRTRNLRRREGKI